MKNCTLAWGLFALAALACAASIYQFMPRNGTAGGTDSRHTIVATPAERAEMLSEMRQHLLSVRKITRGVAAKDYTGIAATARAAGNTARQKQWATQRDTLPEEFKQFSANTHKAFDELALNAEQMQDMGLVSEQLAVLMDNCVACHWAYRLVPQ